LCPKVLGPHEAADFGASPRAVCRRLGQQEFDIMKKLLVAASVIAGVAVGAVPAFAQSATTGQADGVGWVEAHNHNRARAVISNEAYVGRGSDSDYLRQQQELQNTPGYSIGGNG